MNNMEIRLDFILELMSDEEWSELKFKMESKRAFRTKELISAKMKSAISFADWILEKNVTPGYDEKGNSCWVSRFADDYTYISSNDLYQIYITGEWDDDFETEVGEE